jgi:hypothetical protein
MTGRLEIHAQRVLLHDGIELWVAQRLDGGRTAIAQPLVMVEVDVGIYAPPTMLLKHDTAQQFMDQLWLCGVRPTEGTGSAGALAATERHLADMRDIGKQLLAAQLGRAS